MHFQGMSLRSRGLLGLYASLKSRLETKIVVFAFLRTIFVFAFLGKFLWKSILALSIWKNERKGQISRNDLRKNCEISWRSLTNPKGLNKKGKNFAVFEYFDDFRENFRDKEV